MSRYHLFVAAAVVAVLCATAAASATPPGDNGKLAFRRWLDPGRTWGAIFTSEPDGSGIRQITHPPRRVADVEPDWSPDGTKIVFQRIDLDGCGRGCETDEIVVMSSDGSHLTRIGYDPPGKGCVRGTNTAGGVCRAVPVWSPDGEQIAFQCQVQPSAGDPGYSRICVMDADGSDVRELPQDPPTGLDDGQPAWSADGRQLAFARGVRDERAVFVMDADGSDPRQVTPWALRGGQPDWSPDGRLLVLYSNRDGSGTVSANLYTVAPDGRGLRRITHASGGRVQYLSASFAPDGRWIAVGRTPGVGTAGNADLFVLRVNGSGERNVTRSAIWDSGVDWGPRPGSR
jgi:Tol biopolymer transport system component